MTRSLPTCLGDNEARILSALLSRYADLPLVSRASLLSRLTREVPGECLTFETVERALSTDVALDFFDPDSVPGGAS